MLDSSRTIDTRTPSTTGISTPPLEGDSREAVLNSMEAAAAQSDFNAFMASLPVSLSPAMIFAMLQKRMNGLDSQIQSRIGDVEERQHALETLQGHVQEITAVIAGANAGGKIWGSDSVTIDGVSKTVDQWIEGTGVMVNGTTVHDDGNVNNGRTWYSPEALQQAVDSIQADIKQVNQGNELQMMDIQSLMQQRSSEISLATNMLKSVQDGTDAIVRNIG